MVKGHVAAKAPIKVEVEAGKDYWWCACGLSQNQPFCDGSHKGSEFAPVQWTAEEDSEKWFCACKQTGALPFCDGSHNTIDKAAEQEPVAGPLIQERDNGPLFVRNCSTLTGGDGEEIATKPAMALCRCGRSKNKPFCDGTHKEAGFSSARGDVEKLDRVFTYDGNEVMVYYNPLLCSHAAECGRLHKAVFDSSRKPWIKPDEGAVDATVAVIEACPSGALRYAPKGEEPRHIVAEGAEITVEKNGPYWVRNIPIEDVRWGEGAAPDKYVLCRCGLSRNKPFCDGTHVDEGWRDDAD